MCGMWYQKPLGMTTGGRLVPRLNTSKCVLHRSRPHDGEGLAASGSFSQLARTGVIGAMSAMRTTSAGHPMIVPVKHLLRHVVSKLTTA